MDRVFLDANVLFSAAYREDSRLSRLWDVDSATLVTSAYALDEARRNLDTSERKARLDELASRLQIYPFASRAADLPVDIELPANDRPILQAAIDAGASHLLSGDRKAFGRYFGNVLLGVLVMKPADYLASLERV